MITPNPMAGRLRIGGVVSAILLVVVGLKLYGPHRRLEPSVASVSSRPAPIGPTPSSVQRPMTVAKDEPGEHPAPDEYGLIFNRLMLLEAMAPSAMDEVNFEAMAEAFKDLINMARDLGTE